MTTGDMAAVLAKINADSTIASNFNLRHVVTARIAEQAGYVLEDELTTEIARVGNTNLDDFKEYLEEIVDI